MRARLTMKARKRYEGAVRIYLQPMTRYDPLARIGAGWRFVIPKVGRKWVRLTVPANGKSVRVLKAEWLRILGTRINAA